MKLKYLGMKMKIIKLLYNLKNDYKIESIFILIAIVTVLITKNCDEFYQLINHYLSDNRCAGIVSYLAVVIGIYITVWSIFSTSVSKLNEELLKRHIDEKLLFLISIGVFESLATIILCVFIPKISSIYTVIVFCFVVLSVISFMKFIVVLFMITKLNIQFTVVEIDAKRKYDNELMMKIEEIYDRIVEE